MSTRLKIGDRVLDGDHVISALIQYRMLDTLVGHLLLDDEIKKIPLSEIGRAHV